MIDQKIERNLTVDPPRSHTDHRLDEVKGIELWLKSIDKWLRIFGVWKKESSLLQNLVTLTVTGQHEPLSELKSSSQEINNLIREIRGLEKELIRFREQTPLMHRNQIYYCKKYLEAKKYIKALSNRYTKAKTRLLEELALAYPLMIF